MVKNCREKKQKTRERTREKAKKKCEGKKLKPFGKSNRYWNSISGTKVGCNLFNIWWITTMNASWIERWKTKWVKVAKGIRCPCVESIKSIKNTMKAIHFLLLRAYTINIIDSGNSLCFPYGIFFSAFISKHFLWCLFWMLLQNICRCICLGGVKVSLLWVFVRESIWCEFLQKTIVGDHAKQQSTSISHTFFSRIYKNRMNVWFMSSW